MIQISGYPDYGLKDETMKAYDLLKDHEAVVLHSITRYLEDGYIIGQDTIIIDSYDDIKCAQDFITSKKDEQNPNNFYWMIKRKISEAFKSYNLVEGDIPL